MFRHYVFERVISPEWADRPGDRESFVSFMPNYTDGISYFSMKPAKQSITRLFYVSRDRSALESLIVFHPSETVRMWECIAFVKFQAAHRAYNKDCRLLFETLTSIDLARKRREDIVGAIMLDAHAAGMSIEQARELRDTTFAALNNKSRE